MLIFTKITEIQAFLRQQRSSGKTIGFVPTMGALHQGHLSLVDISKKNGDVTVCSIFVNPTQFNDKKDLERYPRMPEKDAELLKIGSCDALFLPDAKEIYPEPVKANFDFGDLDKVLEGKYRPGHFNGVAQVVKRLFEIVEPNSAYFGSKDYQQVLIVKALVKQMRSDIHIVACPILRESDGLAMSSRNTLLSPQERRIAAIIPTLMKEAKQVVLKEGIAAAQSFVSEKISKVPEIKLDYYEVCDPNSLASINSFKQDEKAISLIAVFVGKIRLIDNLDLN